MTERFHEIEIQNIGRIKAKTVYIEFRDPESDCIKQIVPHFGISEVELDEQIITAPVVI